MVVQAAARRHDLRVVVVAEHAGRDVRQYNTLYGICQGSTPSLSHTTLMSLTAEALTAIGRMLSNHV